MKCRYCNADIEQDALFCTNCGKKLSHQVDAGSAGSKMWLWLVIVVLLLALIGGGYWYYSQKHSLNKVAQVADTEVADTMENDPVAVEAAESRKAMREGSTELDAKEALQEILSKIIRDDIDANITLQDVMKYFTKDFKTYFTRACEKADKESCERPRIWWQYSDSDPASFTIKSVEYVSDDLVKAVVKLKGELYQGTYEVMLKNEDDKWLIDQVTEKSVDLLEQEPPQPKKSKKSKPVVKSGGVNLGYAIYRGPMKRGKPHGVNGKMTFKYSHIIDSRDPKRRYAERGDYVIGEWYDGHLVQGVWYDSYHHAKGSILIGK